MKTIDFYTTIIDNYGDAGFSFNLAISLLYYYPNLKIRYFSDDEKLFLKLKGNLKIKNIKYFNLKEIKKLKPSKTIFNFFDKKIDFDYLHTFDYKITFINFSYFLMHFGVGSLHNTEYSSKNVEVTHFIPSLLKNTGGIIINPYLIDFKKEVDINGLIHLRKQILPNLEEEIYNKKWISVFCYQDTFDMIKENILEDKSNIYLIFDNNLTGENIINMPFLNILDYCKFLYLCDKNIVRGENSLVGAILAGKPFLWDIYKEHNGAHKEKVEDFSNYLQNNFGDIFSSYIKLFKGFNNPDNTMDSFRHFSLYKFKNEFEDISLNINVNNNLIKNINNFLL